MKHFISLGAGVQSSTMALMAARGEITPMPDAAVFADTKAEPASVYAWLDWLEKQLPFPVYRVAATGPSLEETELTVRRSKKSGNVYRRSMIPAFGGGGGIFPRKCTREFKITPILRKVRELAGVPRRGRHGVYAIQWIGISTDEAMRMKPSREPWTDNRWPLIENNISRQMCLKWWEDRGLPKPPRSACVFCPYHNDDEWRRLKTDEPAEFARAVDFEKRLHTAALKDDVARTTPFLHSSRQPLDQVDFAASKGKPNHQLNLFGNECEGMCGV